MKPFWRKPAKTLITVLALFVTTGLLGSPVYALENEDENKPADNSQPAENTGNETPNETQEEDIDPIEPGDTGIQPGHITALLQEGEGSLPELLAFLKDHPTELKIEAFQVATAKPDKPYDSYVYPAVSPFTVSGVDLSTYDRLKQMDSARKWEDFSQKLTEIVKTKKPAGHQLTYKTKSEDLNPGLYLILAHGNMADYFVSEEVSDPTPEDPAHKTTKLFTVFDADTHRYIFTPILIAVPNTEGDNLTPTTTDKTPWILDLNVYLKPEEKPLYGNLKINKVLDPLDDRMDNGKVTPMTAVFTITGWKTDAKGERTGDPVYHNVASITVPNATSVIVEHIPVGTWIEVTETYTGSGYERLSGPVYGGDADDHVIIEKPSDKDPEKDAKISIVSFTDKYSNELKKGYGVMNSFTYEETTASDGTKRKGWTWENDLVKHEAAPASSDSAAGGNS